MPSLTPSPPLSASLLRRGLVDLGLQSFDGFKSFVAGTAANGERALTVGTSVADGSVNEGFSLFSARTGIGGTEVEWLKIRRPVTFGAAVLEVDGNGITNTYAQRLLNAGAGVSGLQIYSPGNQGYGALTSQQFGAPFQLYVENKGMQFSQNSNAYDSTTLMKFIVNHPTQLATTVPAFDFQSGVLGSGQKLVRWLVNVSEVAALSSSGQFRAGGGLLFNLNYQANSTDGDQWQLDRAGAVKAYWSAGVHAYLQEVTIGLRAGNGAGASDVGVKVGSSVADGTVNASAKLLSVRTGLGGTEVEKLAVFKDGTIENFTNGAGLVLRSPDGTRWRFTISNAGAAVIALA